MKAVQLHGYGDVDQLHYEDVPEPKPGFDQVLVKVAGACGECEILAKRLKLSEIREADKIAEKGGSGKVLLIP